MKKSGAMGFPKWLAVLLIFALTMLLVAGLGVIYVDHTNEFQLEIAIRGDAEITLEYGETYEDLGAEAFGYGTLLKKDRVSCPVTVTGEVNVEKLGTYQLEYHAVFEGVSKTVCRTVKVVDRTAPVITLTSDPEHFTFPGEAYQEEGFAAQDNYDGDLTSHVKWEEKDGTVVYTVSDTSGNQTQITREIHYDDPVPPKLTLKGKEQITITEGDSWKEPGYSASDNVDGDITDKVTVTGEVDTKKPGTYQLTYQVSDGYNNTVKETRKVTVKAKPAPQPSVPTQPQTPTQPQNPSQSQPSGSNGKTIYLTFDDGPGKHTLRLLDILAKYNVKATFFVCGSANTSLLDEIAAGGHTLAIHSMTHNYSEIYSSEKAFYNDLYAMRDVISSKTGISPVITRFPGGSSNNISKKYCVGIMTQLTKSIQEKGFYYFDWNVDSNDAGGTKTADGVYQNVIKGISGSSRKNHYVLQHDIYGYSVDAVERIIKWGLDNGYQFRAITTDSPVCHHGVRN
jgi:peptidoglycan/xylan/chitin deacetylase (PgdA/CDA1 family)